MENRDLENVVMFCENKKPAKMAGVKTRRSRTWVRLDSSSRDET